MESTIERELPDNQAGFRKARRTQDHIANMRWIMERQLEYGQEVHKCFIHSWKNDYSKAFDCINHELLWKTLLEIGIPKHQGRGGAMVETMTFNRRVVDSTPAPMPRRDLGPLSAVARALRRETPIQYLCCSRECLWVVEDLKGRYRNGRNEWMNEWMCKYLTTYSSQFLLALKTNGVLNWLVDFK